MVVLELWMVEVMSHSPQALGLRRRSLVSLNHFATQQDQSRFVISSVSPLASDAQQQQLPQT